MWSWFEVSNLKVDEKENAEAETENIQTDHDEKILTHMEEAEAEIEAEVEAEEAEAEEEAEWETDLDKKCNRNIVVKRNHLIVFVLAYCLNIVFTMYHIGKRA